MPYANPAQGMFSIHTELIRGDLIELEEKGVALYVSKPAKNRTLLENCTPVSMEEKITQIPPYGFRYAWYISDRSHHTYRIVNDDYGDTGKI